MGSLGNRLRYFVGDALDEWRHSPGVNLLAVATLAMTLFLAGLVMLIIANLETHLERQRDNVQVHVYLRNEVTAEQLATLQQALGAMAGVTGVEHVDKAEALRRYRQWAEQMVELLEDLEANPLPASLVLTLEPGEHAEAHGDAVVAMLAGHEAVEDVRFDRDWLRRLESLLHLARIGGSGLAVLVFAAVVFVMASVLRLAVYARRDEIEIMMLVGATPGFVRGPFLVAGLFQGVLAGLIGLLLVELTRRAITAYAGSSSVALLNLVVASALPAGASMLLLLIGIVVSLGGAFFAVRQSV